MHFVTIHNKMRSNHTKHYNNKHTPCLQVFQYSTQVYPLVPQIRLFLYTPAIKTKQNILNFKIFFSISSAHGIITYKISVN